MRITEMVESEEGSKLSFGDKLRYNIHLAFCKACRSYEKQSKLIGKALGRVMSSSPQAKKTMDATTKKKILDEIKKSQD